MDADDTADKSRLELMGSDEWYLEDLSTNVRSVLNLCNRKEGSIASFALYNYQKADMKRSLSSTRRQRKW